jgi:DNA polymerase I-like protein with 3'-5' exonuclease and polymerase domains
MPPHVLIKYGEIKNKICNYVFQTCSKPANYDYVVGVARVLTEIKNTKLNIDMTPLKKRRHEFKVRQFIRKMKRTSPYIIYDMRGTKTGRLAAREFPILTMDKSYRKIIKPNNKWFLELDYNAAELRVLLSLSEREQPKEDIHDWNLKNIYGNTGSRESAKKRIFAWLYNPSSKDVATSNVYNRTDVLKRYWDGTHVKTHFGRIIEADKHHALNYIVQSTAADLFLRQMIKVGDFLRDKKSKIAFCLHDSLVIDLHEEDEHFINEIKGIFANTELGTFKVNSHGGRNFGEMKRINVN